jgi:cytochrome P450
VARGLRPHVEELVDRLLDRAGDHHFDVVTDVAAALAMEVAALLLDRSRDVRALLQADHLSVADLTGNAVLALLDFPDEADRIRREPALVHCAVDEVLRYDTPMPMVLRTAAKPIELPWGLIERGSTIELSIAAANHDPRVFANPEQLRIARVDNPHLSFGLDRRRCIGAALATLQCEVIISKLFERFSWIELDGFIVRKQQPGVRGLTSLPVRVIPR